MPTPLGRSNSSIYGDIELPKLLSITGPQSLGHPSAGPNAAMVKLGLEQQKEQQIQQLASQYLSDPDNPDYDGFVKARAQIDPDGAFANGKALEDWRISTAKKDVEQSSANQAKLENASIALRQVAEQPGLYTPEFRAGAVKQFGPLADKVLPATDDPDAPAKIVNVLTGMKPLQDYLKGRTEAVQQFADGKKVEGALGLLAISNTPELWASNSKQVKAMGMGALLDGIHSPEEAESRRAAYQAQQPQKAGESAKIGSFEDYMTADPQHRAQILADRKAYGQADDRPPQVRVSVAGATPSPNATIEDLAKGSGYSPDGLRKAARAYHESGNLPALGMGSGKAKQAIQNAEALLYGAEGDLAMSGADFKAKAAALGSMTKQLAAVRAYEGTGLANLKMFTDLAKNIPDTGVPWLNTPLRSLSANVAGSENMAAINAARQVALTEISKVVNNPNLTGSLSDSAREEVLGLIPENATFGQILHVAKVLQKDMAQRPSNIQKQIANLRYEMSHPGESAPEETPQQTGGQSKYQVGQVVTVKGQKVKITNVLPNGQFQGLPVQ